MTSREDFNKTWLVEMPQRVEGVGDLFSIIKHSIEEMLTFVNSEELTSGYSKIMGSQVAYYWHEDNDEIDIACELSIRPQALVVNALGKSNISTTYASDLYGIILRDNHKSILMSDEKLSDGGLALWKRLISLGHTVSVYDRTKPSNIISLKTPEELDEFFSDHKDFQSFQYLLSEGQGMKLAETRSYFNTRRMRELSGLL